ncbi:putative gustatory receptor 85a [Drosophila guanche]|uniref:Gustatory receptor n=1 Tax=Drosophila guanche TaxID=7266 RepID=A0A3B0KA54_DROGU|nr:putative gustatory receptor 85a [Drosophila guanche]SPP80438.1 blast:Putative gustatory receptor 85a [Drosophila guanche]
MSSLKRLIQLSFGYFCALNGIAAFYFGFSSGKLHWSRILGYYRIVHNFIVISLTFKFMADFWQFHTHVKNSRSQLMELNCLAHFAMVVLSLLSCMECTHRQQNRIYAMLSKLLDLNRLSNELGYIAPKSHQRYIGLLVLSITPLLALRLFIHVGLNAIRAKLGFDFRCNCFLSECMLLGIHSVGFGIMAEICQCWWRLQTGLKTILLEEPMPDQLNQLLQLQAMYQCLIDITAEFCSVFKFVLMCFLVRNVWCGIVIGYLIIRIFCGHGVSELHLYQLYLAFVICIQPLLYSLLLNCLTDTTDSLMETTKVIVRESQGQQYLVERSLQWFSLQLAWQHTNIQVYGTYRINRRLVFQSASVIFLHSLYMVQSDYRSM